MLCSTILFSTGSKPLKLMSHLPQCSRIILTVMQWITFFWKNIVHQMDDDSNVYLHPFVTLVICLKHVTNDIYNVLDLSRIWISIVYLWNSKQRTWNHTILNTKIHRSVPMRLILCSAQKNEPFLLMRKWPVVLMNLFCLSNYRLVY